MEHPICGWLHINNVCKTLLLQRRAEHRCNIGTIKSNIARDPVDENQCNPHKFEAFSKANNAITMRSHEKKVLTKFRSDQGPHGATNL